MKKENTLWRSGGVITALITPFNSRGQFDARRFKTQIDIQIRARVSGIVPTGTTGESSTLTFEEHLAVIESAVRFARGRVPVIAGTGANCTKEAIELTQAAEEAGADATLQVVPYYNKPPQEGVFQHFKMIAEHTRLPIMLYSISGRCGIPISVETVVRLAQECPNIVALKEAEGSTERMCRLSKAVPKGFLIFSGDDGLTVPFMRRGAVGVVSVLSNLAPKKMKELVGAARRRHWNHAERLQAALGSAIRLLFAE